MLHNMKYVFLYNVREKSAVFWTLLFPLIMGTLFHLVLGGINDSEKLNKIPVAVIQEGESEIEEQAFAAFLKEMSESILKEETMTAEEAKKALNEGTVTGVFYSGAERSLQVMGNGIEENILAQLLDTYEKNRGLFMDVAQDHPERLAQAAKAFEDYGSTLERVTLGGKTMDDITQYYFALMAMTCLYGCFLGCYASITLQANLSPHGARCQVSPVHHVQQVGSNILTIFLVHFTECILVFLYLSVVLGDLKVGEKAGETLLVLALGSLMGVSLGVLIGSIGKMGEGVKNGIMIGISLTLSFLAGLMVENIQDVVEKNIPVLNRINPAALITDAFYCICVYEDRARYFRDLGILAVLSAGCAVLAFQAVRRVRYDSI